MDRKTLYVPMSIMMILILMTVQPYASTEARVFRGKVIDFNTRRPLEGAVVVAIWFDPGDNPSVKDLKEALTDKDGEWSITGEGGDRTRLHPLPSFLQPFPLIMSGVSQLRNDFKAPQFMIFKPGYEDFREFSGGTYSLLAYPHVDRKRAREGIVLSISDEEERYTRRASQEKSFEATKGYGLPFIPMKNPVRRLRTLEIPFDYPDNVERLYVDVTDPHVLRAVEDFLKAWDSEDGLDSRFKEELVRHFANHFHFTGFLNNYTLFGLKQLKDSKARSYVLTRVRPIELYSGDLARDKAFLKKQKHLLRLFNEECETLGIKNWKIPE